MTRLVMTLPRGPQRKSQSLQLRGAVGRPVPSWHALPHARCRIVGVSLAGRRGSVGLEMAWAAPWQHVQLQVPFRRSASC